MATQKRSKKVAKPTLVSRMQGKVNTYMECLIEYPCGRREYVTGKEFETLTK